MLQSTHSTPIDSQLDRIASKLVNSALSKDDEKDVEEEYDPSNEAEQQQAEQDKADEEQLVKELPSDVTASNFNEDEKEEVESSAESSVDPLDEEALVNSKSFAVELESAMDHVASIAKAHRAEMISSIVSDLSLSTGQEVTDEMVSSAMRTFAVEDMDIADGSTSEEEEEEEIDEDLLAKEMASALEIVRELAEDHQPAFVSRICDLYGEVNDDSPSPMELHSVFSSIRQQFADSAAEISSDEGAQSMAESLDADTLSSEMELALIQVRKQAQLDQQFLVDFIWDFYVDFNGGDPSVEALSDILCRIKEQLAEEEREEFLELNEGGDDDEDSDYEEDADSDAEQYAEDEAADIYIEGEHDGVESSVESESELDEEAAFSFLESIEDEEQLVNDSVFGALWCSAMEHIESVGREDGVSMVLQVLEQFEGETGQRASSEMVASAVMAASTLSFAEDEESELNGIESEDEEEVAIEMVEAVDRARELGALHREQLVHRICDLYAEENGEEPSLNDLYAMFGDIEASFAEEDVEDQEECGEVDAVQFAAEWQSAMEHIEMAAQRDQEEMVNALCDIYCDHHGEEPSTPELYEMFSGIKASFAEEAADDLIESELTAMESMQIESESDDDDETEDEDGDYSPDSDAFDYAVDAVDDVIYHDSEYDEEDESDSDFSEQKDAEQSVYAEDAVDDVAASSESEEEEQGQQDQDQREDEEKASELASDSEYSPDKDATDYLSDYLAEHVETTSDDEEESSSQSPSEDADYDPRYDLNDYDADFEPFQNSDDSHDSQLDEDYSIDKDQFDYTQDQHDDVASSSSAQGTEESEDASRGSGSEQEADDTQVAA